MNLLLRASVVVGLSLLLSSCAVDEPPTLELSPLTLPPPLESTFAGTCDDTRVLESWLQTASFQFEEILILVDEAVLKSPQDLYGDVERMAVLRNAISEQVVPDCAANAHIALQNALDALLPQLQRYANGEAVDVQAAIDAARPAFDDFAVVQADLLVRLEAQFQSQNAQP